jgi:ABC-type glycerol-3-phosphate transport system substrate-binding protein
MMMVRALFLASLLGGLALAACGGAGSGGPYTSAAPATAIPALGTNKPAASPMPSGDPYSDYGY